MFTNGYAAPKMPVPKGSPLKPIFRLRLLEMQLERTETRVKRPTIVASFRMDQKALAALNAKAEAEGITPRTWLEKAALQIPGAHVVTRRKEHPDLRALLFQVSRAGNNINQLAHKFNALDKAGRLGRGELGDAIDALRDVSDLLHKALARAR